MAALNLSCYHPLHSLSHSPSPPRNVSPVSILRDRNKLYPSTIPLTFHKRKLHNSLLVLATTMPTSVQENLPPALDSTSEPPPVFDGTTSSSPFVVGIGVDFIALIPTSNMNLEFPYSLSGLQENIKLVPIDLKNRPDWYKEKVYPANKVPALEHNNEVKGESLDLIKYINDNFQGPSLYPDDPVKKEFGEELLSYTNKFYKSVTNSFKGDGVDEAAAAFDYIENALSKFNDGPFFLGHFSLVDIAYAPFIERFQPYLLDVKNYDVNIGRPKLANWIQEMNKNEDFNQTRRHPEELVESYKKRFLVPIYHFSVFTDLN
ncbi:hypothetical protein LXL04_012495 [Taraxacum kok-saghyz]